MYYYLINIYFLFQCSILLGSLPNIRMFHSSNNLPSKSEQGHTSMNKGGRNTLERYIDKLIHLSKPKRKIIEEQIHDSRIAQQIENKKNNEIALSSKIKQNYSKNNHFS